MEKGLYEKIINNKLASELRRIESVAKRENVDVSDSHKIIAVHLGDLIAAVLRRQPSENRLRAQREIANKLIEVLKENDKNLDEGELLPENLERLLAVYTNGGPPVRPDTPISETSLLTGTRIDPSLLSQLKQELASADRVDILCSFIKWAGFGLLRDALEEFTSRPGTRLRVLTTSYMGATDLAAVKMLAELPDTEVKVSYDVHRTRLHAKAYLFERKSGFSSAYIGSANLSRPALTEGLEWTVKVTEYADAPIWQKVLGTFETYWQDSEFERFDEQRLDIALKKEQGARRDFVSFPVFELRPYHFQQEIIDALDNDRADCDPPFRQLVVAATGTGKTMVSAFDYRNQVRRNNGVYPKLLVVAHRREILQQTLHTFRSVLRDQNFGDLLDATSSPSNLDHVFATVQTLHRRKLPEKWSENKYDYVLIDETHRSAAESYQGILDHLRPKILLGLTATPERTDGSDILRYFDNRVVSEIRLPDAINRRLVAPFHYFGVSDTPEMDYTGITWERGGYRVSELDKLVTGNHVRAQNIVDQCKRRLPSLEEVRGLGFCVSVDHAEFMADFFNKAGIPSEALSSVSGREVRDSVREKLRKLEINFIFVVDLFNEGIDIPEIDTILFLRPTESLTVFLQQLGRGLRLTDDKDYLSVLDFVGQMHRKFRFDQRFRALSVRPEIDVIDEIEDDFPHLPAGCSIQLERVARDRVISNIRQSMLAGMSGLVRDIADFERDTGLELSLGSFLDHYRLDPDAVYRRGSWAQLTKKAGVRVSYEAPDEKVLAKWLRRIAHADDSIRLERWRDWLETGEGDDPLVVALAAPLLASKSVSIGSSSDFWELLTRNPDLLDEARELVAWRLEIVGVSHRRTVDGLSAPLVIHGRYTRDEVLALTGVWNWNSSPSVREGVRHVPDKKLDVFMATIQKSEKHYSPSTLYQDYAISEELFHWQSQSTTSEESPTGQRYIRHEEKGYTPLLFVRSEAKIEGYSQPYYFLGPVKYQYHEGSRPMSIVWKLQSPLPARLMRLFQSLAVA